MANYSAPSPSTHKGLALLRDVHLNLDLHNYLNTPIDLKILVFCLARNVFRRGCAPWADSLGSPETPVSRSALFQPLA